MEGQFLEQGREFFLRIKKNPRDLELRAVYADWLEEFGDGDLDMKTAAEQRSWTLEKQDAKERLQLLARSIGTSYPALMSIFRHFLALGQTVTVMSQDFNPSMLNWTGAGGMDLGDWWHARITDAWRDYALLTGEDTSRLWFPGWTELRPLPSSSPFSFRN